MITCCISLTSCGENEPPAKQELIASSQGYELTESHFETYLKYVENFAGETADLKTQIAIKSQLKETFLKEPEALLKQLDSLSAEELKPPFMLENKEAQSSAETYESVETPMAEGHKIVRDLLGSDIGEMRFDTPAANTFRTYVANTLLTATTGNYNTGITGSDSRNTNSQTQFCANGTYTEALSGHVSIQTNGAGAVSSGTTNITGYWDVASLPNGMMIIVMYSTHPYVLEDWPNGIMPFVVAKYGADFMALPSGDLYRRAANQFCN
ncbi:hypothetical protein FGM00_15520 [Aggregatimonas sangjinii]|uniref:Uncharacterized protein n=1 Tax=Aggregatimonas sangjinii TaxID=2583587 RepID=A0A5B7SSE5_9FLAO|nr:hypothetical protein [Aggregatimonas sangjinii]QCX01447.1 hypothetical protein FGM00_15520 [Aggregatimonas sangjinii]